MQYDLLIHNGILITVNAQMDVFGNGLVCIKDGLLKRVEKCDHHSPLPPARQILDAEGGIIMPGLVNAHTHSPMTLFRGLADDLPLDVWLHEHIFPAEARHINPENVRHAAALACAEMLLGGTTTCCDGYFYEDGVAKIMHDAGMRAVVGQGVIDFPAPGVPDPSQNISVATRFVERWKNVSARIRPSIFCHAPYTCSESTLRKAKTIADENDVLFQIHAAETQNESHMIAAADGRSPIQYLDHCRILDRKTLLVHCVWADQADVDIIAAHDAGVAHNPSSNLKLAAGIAPVPLFLTANIPVGIGTDGCASNNNLDMLQEMDLAAKLHKGQTHNPIVTDAATVLKMATLNGARAIGWDDHIGSLEPGKAADLIIIDTNKAHMTPIYNPISHLVYAASGADVRHVIVEGRVLVRNRVLQTLNLEEVMAQMHLIAQQII